MKKIICILLCTLMLLVSMPVAFAADTAPYRISVSINGDSKTSRGLCWYTSEATDSIVRIYCDGSDVTDTLNLFAASCNEWEGSYVHKLTVGSLTPGKTYTYSIDGVKGTFTTDDGDSSFKFITIADVQASSAENFEKGAATLKAAFETAPDAQFVLNCGDFTNDSTNEEWNLFDASFSTLNRSTTLVPVSGNHDGLGVWHWFDNMFNLDTSESVQNLNGVNYSFDYGNAHVAILNTNDLLSISNAQLKWLENDMNSTKADWKIVAMHKSPYTLGKDGKWPDALYLQQSLTKVLDNTDVDLVFSGHDHMYLRTKALKGNKVNADGTVYVLAGTAGSKRYEVRSFLADSFLKKDFIGAMTVQKGGYGNYWNGSDWSESKESNIGGCFSTVTVNGGTLTLDAYILADSDATVSKIDTLTLTKHIGENKATYDGMNTTSAFRYAADVIPSFICLAAYTFIRWLPKFIFISPKIISTYVNEGTF